LVSPQKKQFPQASFPEDPDRLKMQRICELHRELSPGGSFLMKNNKLAFHLFDNIILIQAIDIGQDGLRLNDPSPSPFQNDPLPRHKCP
jgi:hypothetical protein